ncbi:MAG: CsbD family protein [Weeksellaceae bacterium]|nr:CsbD family protein [Weeksellaceae bacterium]
MSSFSDQVKGNWNQAKGKLKQQWADLTDDDLLYTEGKEDEVMGRIQEKTGETKENINKFFDDMKFD